MFKQMDRLYLMRKGETIYDGLAKDIVPYM